MHDARANTLIDSTHQAFLENSPPHHLFSPMSITLTTLLDHPTPVATSIGICCLIASINLSNSPRISTELRIIHRCMKDTNLYKIVLGVGIILFLKTKSFLFSHIVQHTAPKRKKQNPITFIPPLT
jgi:hypothetical protein